MDRFSFTKIPYFCMQKKTVSPQWCIFQKFMGIPEPSDRTLTSPKLLRLGKKKNKFFCFALDFS